MVVAMLPRPLVVTAVTVVAREVAVVSAGTSILFPILVGVLVVVTRMVGPWTPTLVRVGAAETWTVELAAVAIPMLALAEVTRTAVLVAVTRTLVPAVVVVVVEMWTVALVVAVVTRTLVQVAARTVALVVAIRTAVLVAVVDRTVVVAEAADRASLARLTPAPTLSATTGTIQVLSLA
jgi:hypothetical protein